MATVRGGVGVGGSQSSSSRPPPFEYQVFLSFRGEDTRKNFTDHLYTALINAGFHTFRDDDELERGEDIASELEKAIRQSLISVVVFSKDYASSRWCLDELANILQRKKNEGQLVLPVFYNIDPSDVRKQTGTFADAFLLHEKRFEAEMDRVEGWRVALKEAADLAGMNLQNQANGHEARFIQNIVKEIGSKLNRTMLSVPLYPTGTDSRVEDINSWLQDGSSDVGIGVIYGMGGIGKTTIAKIAYNMNYRKFEGSSFLASIREASQQPNGLVRLQTQLLSDIRKGKRIRIYNVDEGIMKIKDAVCCKRIFVVLDDIDQLDQLNAILGMWNWFYPGSKIIITTRHKSLMKAYECKIFTVKELDNHDSMELFSWHAFGQDHPIEGYIEHSKSIVQHCGGLPLALQVLGSSLSGSRMDVWKRAPKKLTGIPESQILETLKISYDSLQDDHDKNLFLDIACFFVGMNKDIAIAILDGCDFHTMVGIENLMDRSLLAIDKDKLQMHQLHQDMGREIIRQESPMDPGERSRLWKYEDAFSVLSKKTGKDTIEGFFLNFPKLEKNISFEGDAFVRMHKLRLLSLNYVQFSGGYENFPKDIRWLCWEGFPMEFIPTKFDLENLVVLEMRKSCLTHLWKIQFWSGAKFLVKLKILDLSYSHSLIKTPDFSRLPCLERLMLEDCISLVEVHDSIGDLKCLVFLNLKGCKNLRKLPHTIGMLRSLEVLILSGCSKLELPEELLKLEACRTLLADETTIKISNRWHSLLIHCGLGDPSSRNDDEEDMMWLSH